MFVLAYKSKKRLVSACIDIDSSLGRDPNKWQPYEVSLKHG